MKRSAHSNPLCPQDEAHGELRDPTEGRITTAAPFRAGTPEYRRWYEAQPERKSAHLARVTASYRALSPAERFAMVSNRDVPRLYGQEAAIEAADLAPLEDGCAYCGNEPVGWDHVVPLSRGGAHHCDNLVPVCGTCNKSKSAYTPDEWLAVGLYRGRRKAA